MRRLVFRLFVYFSSLSATGDPLGVAIVDEYELNRKGRCVRQCLQFMANLDGLGKPPLPGVVGAAAKEMTHSTGRALLQFMYHDIRRAIQIAAWLLARLNSHVPSSYFRQDRFLSAIGNRLYSLPFRNFFTVEQLVEGLHRDVWPVLRQAVLVYDVTMRQQGEQIANRTDLLVDIGNIRRVLAELEDFVISDPRGSYEDWDRLYKSWRVHLSDTARVLKLTIAVDNGGKCFFSFCRLYKDPTRQ